jgi:acetyl-CoA carboxylase biotin carboxyl carrier protein
MTIKPTDIVSLVELFSVSDWEELHVEIDGLQLFLSRDPNARLAHGGSDAPVSRTSGVDRPARAEVAVAPPKQGTPSAVADDVPSHWIAVKAPNLGTFYRAPKPGAAPYVEVGQRVDADSEICQLEVMKLFTVVKAGMTGIVRRICVEDAQMVEHAQILLYIERV